MILISTEKDEVVDKETHKQFRSGVGMLFYLIKISSPACTF
jgi:hypothetical protein